jgi:hypothetical protein
MAMWLYGLQSKLKAYRFNEAFVLCLRPSCLISSALQEVGSPQVITAGNRAVVGIL